MKQNTFSRATIGLRALIVIAILAMMLSVTTTAAFAEEVVDLRGTPPTVEGSGDAKPVVNPPADSSAGETAATTPSADLESDWNWGGFIALFVVAIVVVVFLLNIKKIAIRVRRSTSRYKEGSVEDLVNKVKDRITEAYSVIASADKERAHAIKEADRKHDDICHAEAEAVVGLLKSLDEKLEDAFAGIGDLEDYRKQSLDLREEWEPKVTKPKPRVQRKR